MQSTLIKSFTVLVVFCLKACGRTVLEALWSLTWPPNWICSLETDQVNGGIGKTISVQL